MLERFTKAKERSSARNGKVNYNLDEEEELTHYGKSINTLDDFDNSGLRLDDDDEEPDQIDGKTVGKVHFGGFSDDDEDDEDDDGRVSFGSGSHQVRRPYMLTRPT